MDRYYDMNRSRPTTLLLRPVTADDLIHDLHNYTKSSKHSKSTRSGTMTSTGHDRRLWGGTLGGGGGGGGHIFKTGHCRRLYTRFTQLGQVPQNTLKIHGRVL